MKLLSKILFALLIPATGFAAKISSSSEITASGKTAYNSPQDRSCHAAYENMLSDQVIKIRMVFGYKDTRPARFVGDRHERLSFVRKILKPCHGGRQDCGFVRHPDNADLFFKTIPGLKSNPIRVELYIAHSSVASDDEANRNDPFQKWQSRYAQKAFFGGIESADVVFYNGHSRFGGGPDFAPPVLNAKGEPDVQHYQSLRPGFQIAMEKLKYRTFSEISKSGLSVLGLFSCASSQHFSDSIMGDSTTALISNKSLIYYADALENSLTSLSALLELRCEKDFKKMIHHHSPIKGAQIQNFF